MMKGMIDYLTGSSTGAQVLRKHFLFKVVPMLNPDGVVNGNTRVNLAGWDLNRKWSYPVEKLFPTVYHLKRLIATLQARDRVAIYCDLHGHSLNRNIFTYGCYNKKATKRSTAYLGTISSSLSNATLSSSTGGSSSSNIAATSLRASVKNDPRVFPMIVAKHAPFFSFASCDFKVHKSKLNTARVVVNHELGVINSYTLEASFCGPDFGPRKDTQFATWDLEEMGQAWCQSLLIYFDLVADVKALDAQLASAQSQDAVDPLAPNALTVSRSGPGSPLVGTPTSAMLEMTGSLLSDCEAAISELFASATEVEYDDDAADMVSMDSDLSGAEDEPIPPSGAELFVRERSGHVDSYSSAPEDGDGGNEHASPERAGQRPRRKSRGPGRKTSKKSNKHRSKSSKAKKDKTRAPDAPVALVDDEMSHATSVSEHPALDAAASATGSKKKSMSKPPRRKSKSSKERSKSFRRLKKAAASDESEDDDVPVEPPVSSARATSTHPDAVVLPSMPGSAGRRLSRTTTLSVALGSDTDQQQVGDSDAARQDDRAFICPTPPAHKGRAKLVRTASPPPIELPLLRTGESGSSGFKERVVEARVPLGARHMSGRSDSDDDDNGDEYEDTGDGAASDSDASVQSGPESYLSEF